MKKYMSCFLFFLFLTGGCLVALFFLTIGQGTEEVREVQVTESPELPVIAETMKETMEETEAELLAHVVLNQQEIIPETAGESYCLMAEEGYLIVYDSRSDSVSLFTHMPLAEFPLEEQERLMEGIWFPTMAEIFSYLESYTS